MNLKRFFRPTWTKIIILLVLIALSLFLKINTDSCFNYCPPGILCAAVCSPTPLFFIPVSIFTGSGFAAHYLTNLIIPMLVFWYVISCAAAAIFKK